jgi:hypothetical protein
LQDALDAVRERFGRDAIKRASDLEEGKVGMLPN